MRLFVTGAAGFLGSRVVRRLLSRDDTRLTALVRSTTDLARWNSLDPARRERIRLAFADLRDVAAVRRVVRESKAEVAIHLAMAYHPPGSPAGQDIDEINLQATLALQREFVATGGRRFVQAGSCFEYGDQDHSPLDETTPARPAYAYAIAKAKATEGLLERAEVTNAETFVLRVFSPYGPGEDWRRLVPQLLLAGLTGVPCPMTPGEQTRDFVYADDVAEAFALAALKVNPPRPRAIYNVGTGVGLSIRQLAEVAGIALNRKLTLRWGALEYRRGEIMRLVGDPKNIRQDLGWQASRSPVGGLKLAGEEWRAWLQRDAGRSGKTGA